MAASAVVVVAAAALEGADGERCGIGGGLDSLNATMNDESQRTARRCHSDARRIGKQTSYDVIIGLMEHPKSRERPQLLLRIFLTEAAAADRMSSCLLT